MDLKQTQIRKRGLETDKLLLDTIKDYPGLSQYETHKETQMEKRSC
jgi:hypothetical protein